MYAKCNCILVVTLVDNYYGKHDVTQIMYKRGQLQLTFN